MNYNGDRLFDDDTRASTFGSTGWSNLDPGSGSADNEADGVTDRKIRLVGDRSNFCVAEPYYDVTLQ